MNNQRTGFLNVGPIWDADERLGTYVEIRAFGWLFRKEFIWTRHRFDEKVSKPWVVAKETQDRGENVT